MTSTIVFSTTTEAARRRRTGLAGINRVASAPTYRGTPPMVCGFALGRGEFCERTDVHSHATCEWDESCPNEGARIVGDLVVCTSCAPKASHHAHNIGDGYGNVLCYCGYPKPKGAECGEPCL